MEKRRSGGAGDIPLPPSPLSSSCPLPFLAEHLELLYFWSGKSLSTSKKTIDHPMHEGVAKREDKSSSRRRRPALPSLESRSLALPLSRLVARSHYCTSSHAGAASSGAVFTGCSKRKNTLATPERHDATFAKNKKGPPPPLVAGAFLRGPSTDLSLSDAAAV